MSNGIGCTYCSRDTKHIFECVCMVSKTHFKSSHMCGYNKQRVICMCTRNPEASVMQCCVVLPPMQSYICATISETPSLIALTPRRLSLVLIDGCHARFPGRLLVIAPSLGSLLVHVRMLHRRNLNDFSFPRIQKHNNITIMEPR